MIVKRRFYILRNLIDEFDLSVEIIFVPTSKNKADELTRVKKTWLTNVEDDENEGATVCAGTIDLEKVHNMHHVAVERSLFLSRNIDLNVTRPLMKEMVSGCKMCQSIDPPPVVHNKGELGVIGRGLQLTSHITGKLCI